MNMGVIKLSSNMNNGMIFLITQEPVINGKYCKTEDNQKNVIPVIQSTQQMKTQMLYRQWTKHNKKYG